MTSISHSGISKKYRDDFFLKQKTIFLPKAELLGLLHNKEFAISDEYIYTLYRHHFGEYPDKISKLSRSTLHDVYKIESKNHAYIVRCNKFPNYFKELQFVIDAKVTKKLREQKITVPQILTTDVSRKIIPTDYQISEYVSGEPLDQLVNKKKSANSYISSFGNLLAKVHRVRASRFGPFNLLPLIKESKLQGVHQTWSDYLTTNLSEHIIFCREQNVIEPEVGKNIESILRKAIKLIRVKSPVVLHGDVAHHNIIVQTDQETLIDFEDTIAGDSIYDIAYYGTGTYKHQKWLKCFLSGYTVTTQLPKDFLLRYWTYYLRIALAKAKVRLLSGNADEAVKKRINTAFFELSLLVHK